MITHFTEEDKKKLQARYAEDQERTFLSYLQQSYDEGREEEKIAIAKNLYKMKMSLEDISKATGLYVEQIKKL